MTRFWIFVLAVAWCAGLVPVPSLAHEYIEQVPGGEPAAGLLADVCCVVVGPGGAVWVGTGDGLAIGRPGGWRRERSLPDGAVTALWVGERVLAAVGERIFAREAVNGAFRELGPIAPALGTVTALAEASNGQSDLAGVWIGTATGLHRLTPGSGEAVVVTEVEGRVFALATAAAGCDLAVGAEGGAYLRPCEGDRFERLLPRAGDRSWAMVDVRGVGFSDGALWIASPQGLARRGAEGSWRLWNGSDGLPFNDIRGLAVDRATVWLATSKGAIRYTAGGWEYRQGRRWLPSDVVRSVALADGTAWFATAGGLAWIESRAATLADKAAFFEEQIDRYHRRTSYGYVDAVSLDPPGQTAAFEQHDSDNDGLWTGMYGAGECFAYAATGRGEYKRRAEKALRALAFLSEVTQGGSHAVEAGFVARSILPTAGRDPNVGHRQRDRDRRADRDGMWKLLSPRWPTSADGEWYWKTDASSDELDGHYFLYAAYYDLVAETPAERAAVREVVARVTDHLIRNSFALVDHDGQPTRWAVFGPDRLNHDMQWWGERGLNSLSILSYLRVAAHVTGEPRYDQVALELIEKHAYAANVRSPKVHAGPGSGNQSDDEMAFMSFYNLLRYEKDAALREIWAHAFHRYFELERPERNPLFNYLYAGAVEGLRYVDAWGEIDLAPRTADLADAVDTLERYPRDRVDWALENSHRLDVVAIDPSGERGRRRDGKVLPIDERFVGHWNHDPWQLDYGGRGARLADGTSFLLPYYLGLYLEQVLE